MKLWYLFQKSKKGLFVPRDFFLLFCTKKNALHDIECKMRTIKSNVLWLRKYQDSNHKKIFKIAIFYYNIGQNICHNNESKGKNKAVLCVGLFSEILLLYSFSRIWYDTRFIFFQCRFAYPYITILTNFFLLKTIIRNTLVSVPSIS